MSLYLSINQRIFAPVSGLVGPAAPRPPFGPFPPSGKTWVIYGKKRVTFAGKPIYTSI